MLTAYHREKLIKDADEIVVFFGRDLSHPDTPGESAFDGRRGQIHLYRGNHRQTLSQSNTNETIAQVI